MKSFEYVEPTSVEEAVTFLAVHGAETRPLAGGTDLITSLLHGANPPAFVLSLNSIPSMIGITQDSSLRIGATTVLWDIEQSSAVRRHCRMLAESAAMIGSRQIRNLATMGGNICNAVPSADTAPPLLAADAQVLIQGPRGQRCLPVNEFFTGPRQTVLRPDELVLEFLIPPPLPRTGTVYRRHTLRKALDLAMVGVAVSVTLDPVTDIIQQARIALGAVAPTPLRATQGESALVGNALSQDLVETVAELTERAASPISDVRSSAEYRREMIRVLTRRCLWEAAQRASVSEGGQA